jgi:hypothetical protein
MRVCGQRKREDRSRKCESDFLFHENFSLRDWHIRMRCAGYELVENEKAQCLKPAPDAGQ